MALFLFFYSVFGGFCLNFQPLLALAFSVFFPVIFCLAFGLGFAFVCFLSVEFWLLLFGLFFGFGLGVLSFSSVFSWFCNVFC